MPNNIYNNLSNDELKAGYWYVTHRVLLRKIGISILAIAAGGLLLYGVYGLIQYYVTDRLANLALESDLAKAKLDYSLLAELNAPKGLQILETQAIKSRANYYDLVTEIVNPNQQWLVESFDYYYLINAEKTNIKTDFILPGQDKYVMYLNYESPKTVASANIIVENIKWKKVANYQMLAEKIFKFDFENQKVISSAQSDLSGKEPAANISFDILNKGPYSFWEPCFKIFLYRKEKLIGITQATVDSIASGEKRSLSINVFQNVPRGIELVILPDINILDPQIFKGIGQGSGELK